MRKVAAALLLCALSSHAWAAAHSAKSVHKPIHKISPIHHVGAVHPRKEAIADRAAHPAVISRGIASVYARSLVGRRTATGERLDMSHLTAASLKLPLGTIVTVTNRRNGRKATVRVNDRGPYTRRFVIDLSPAAASALGMGRTGTIPVEIKIASVAHRS